MTWVLLIALWQDGKLKAHAYEYAHQNACENTAIKMQESANLRPEIQVLEIWCYPVEKNADNARE